MSFVYRGARRFIHFIVLVTLSIAALVPQVSAQAASSLTVTPITWNIVGLDSNNVNVGPNRFPIGVRACNPSTNSVSFSDVEADFVWLNGGTQSAIDDSYIRCALDRWIPFNPTHRSILPQTSVLISILNWKSNVIRFHMMKPADIVLT